MLITNIWNRKFIHKSKYSQSILSNINYVIRIEEKK